MRILGIVTILVLSSVIGYAQSGVKYPYVTTDENGNYNIIVSRDINGGVRSELIRTGSWTETPEHNQESKDNAVAGKFQVYEKGNAKDPQYPIDEGVCGFDEAKSFCNNLEGGNWRVPTQRELMLIYVMNDQLSDDYKLITTVSEAEELGVPTSSLQNGIFYWSGTTNTSITESNAWSVCFSSEDETKNGQTDGWVRTAKNLIRCVRDVTD